MRKVVNRRWMIRGWSLSRKPTEYTLLFGLRLQVGHLGYDTAARYTKHDMLAKYDACKNVHCGVQLRLKPTKGLSALSLDTVAVDDVGLEGVVVCAGCYGARK